WEKVLFLNDSTGCIDLVIDVKNPRVLYAGMWRAERKPWTMIDGGHTGGLYKSTDGGDTWKKLGGGFPDSGLIGKIGVAVSPVNPNRVWAIVETDVETKGGVYRSDNAGETWQRVNREHKLRQRAWYYNHIVADTKNENTVYVSNTDFFKSIDGGSTFYDIDTPHGDNHALWINPNFPDYMIQSNDGGANVSFNGGKTWSSIYNQPTAEMYRVTVDNQFPYRIYGAQQDNTTISIPSRNSGGLTPYQQWYAVAGGESGHIAVDPRGAKVIYSGNYIGLIDRIDLSKGHERNVVAYPQMHDGLAGRDIKYRFQWNAPIRLSPHNPDVVYHCSQYVHKSADGGQTWQVISPDLTTNNKKYQNIPGEPIQHDHTGVELYTTIFAFEESTLEKDVLWVGSDDGLLHISMDGGKNWQNITPPFMPKDGTVNSIEVSNHAKGRAFVAVHKYRENDFKPYILFTEDYGKTWKQLADGKNGIPENHFVRVVREDKDKKGLLYAGTEFGMYISFNEGKNWQNFQLNLPITPITDLAVHQKDLVVATQGRSFWILDDLTPLHQFAESTKTAQAQLFKPRTSYKTQFSERRGANFPDPAPNGAILYFYVAKGSESNVRIEISDKSGNIVKAYASKPNYEKKEQTLSAKVGLNRIVWNLKSYAPETIESAVFSLADVGGINLPTGKYQVKMTAGEFSQTQELEVQKNPNWTVTDEDLAAQYTLAQQVSKTLTDCHSAIKKLRDVREQLSQVATRATKAGFDKKIETTASNIKAKLNLLEEDLIQTRSESGQDPSNYPSKIDDQIAYLYSVVNYQDAKPTQGCYDRLEDLKKDLAVHLDRLKVLMDTDIKSFNEMLNKEGVNQVIAPRR
nr:glycosyl hydrolase [Thermoflexibacter sp.]